MPIFLFNRRKDRNSGEHKVHQDNLCGDARNHGRNWDVLGDFPSIQDAVDAARSARNPRTSACNNCMIQLNQER